MISHMTYKNIKEKRFDRANNRRHEAALTVIDQKYEFSKHIMNISSPTLELCQDFLDNFEDYSILIKESKNFEQYTTWEVIHPSKCEGLSFFVTSHRYFKSFSDLELGSFSLGTPSWMNLDERNELYYVSSLVMEKLKNKELLERQKLKETSRQKAIEQLEYLRKMKKIQEVYDKDFSQIMPEER